MNMANRRARWLLALWVLGSLALAALPGFAYAQTAIVDGSTPVNPGITGDPDMPGEKPPASGGPVTWNSTSAGLHAGDSIDPTGRPGYSYSAPRPVSAGPWWRLWLDGFIWAIRSRYGW